MIKIKFPTKAEILITRSCNLNCEYCTMKKYNNPKNDQMSDDLWKIVPKKLSELKIPFAPIYGAEPLMRIDALCNFIEECVKYNIETTVITNTTLLTDKNIEKLKKSGLNSITMSYDGLIPSLTGSIKSKTSSANLLLHKLKNNFKDIEVIFTVTNKNLEHLIPTVISMSELGFYTFFDLIHQDRGQPGSKCSKNINHLLIKNDQCQEFIMILTELIVLKKANKILLHNSIESMLLLRFLISVGITYNWKCKPGSFITIDQDGTVFGCDDYQPEIMRQKYNILDLNKTWNWDEWVSVWSKHLKFCPGCYWSTHIMASQWYKKQDENWKTEMIHQ